MTSKTDEEIADECTFLGEISGGRHMWLRPALFEQDHEAIENVAKQSAVGAAFLRAGTKAWHGELFDEGGVRVLVDVEADGTQRLVGFSVTRTTDGAVSIYLIAVDELKQRKGCGRALFDDIRDQGAPRLYTSTLPKAAEAGLAFSSALGFNENGRTARGGIRLRRDEW